MCPRGEIFFYKKEVLEIGPCFLQNVYLAKNLITWILLRKEKQPQ